MIQPGFEPMTSRATDGCSPNWANQVAVNQISIDSWSRAGYRVSRLPLTMLIMPDYYYYYYSTLKFKYVHNLQKYLKNEALYNRPVCYIIIIIIIIVINIVISHRCINFSCIIISQAQMKRASDVYQMFNALSSDAHILSIVYILQHNYIVCNNGWQVIREFEQRTFWPWLFKNWIVLSCA